MAKPTTEELARVEKIGILSIGEYEILRKKRFLSVEPLCDEQKVQVIEGGRKQWRDISGPLMAGGSKLGKEIKPQDLLDIFYQFLKDNKGDIKRAVDLWLYEMDNLGSAIYGDLKRWKDRSRGALIVSGAIASLIGIVAIPFLAIYELINHRKYKKIEKEVLESTNRSTEFARLFATNEPCQEVATEALRITATSRNRQYVFGHIMRVFTGVAEEAGRVKIAGNQEGADNLLMQIYGNPALWQDQPAESLRSENSMSNFLASKEQREKWLDELISLIRNNPPLHIEIAGAAADAAGSAAAPPVTPQLVPAYARKMALMMVGRIFRAIDVYASPQIALGIDPSVTHQAEPSRVAKEGLIAYFGAMFSSVKGRQLLLESLELGSENDLLREAFNEVWDTMPEQLDRKKECLNIVKALLMAASKITSRDTRQRAIQNILRQYNSFIIGREMEQEHVVNLNPMENIDEVVAQAGSWLDKTKNDEIKVMCNCAQDGVFSNILQVFCEEEYDKANSILNHYLRAFADLRSFSAGQSIGKQKFFANILELKIALDHSLEPIFPAEAVQPVMVGAEEVYPVVFAKAMGLRYLARLTELTADADVAQLETLYTTFGTKESRYELLGRLTDKPKEFRAALRLMKGMFGEDVNAKNAAFDNAIKALLIGLSATDEEEGQKRIKLVLQVYHEEMAERDFENKPLAEINFNDGQEEIGAILSRIQFPIAQFRYNKLLLEKISGQVNRFNVFLWIAKRFNCSEEEKEVGRAALKEFLGAGEARSYATLLPATWNTPKDAKMRLQKDIENIIYVFRNVPGLEEATDLAVKQRNIARNAFARAMAIRYLSKVAQKINGIENDRNKADAKKAFREVLGSKSNRALFSGLLEEKRIPEALSPVLEEVWAMERKDVPEQLEQALNNCFEDMKVMLGSLVRLGREKDIPQVIKVYEEFVVGKIMLLGDTVEQTKRKNVLLLEWTGKIAQWLATANDVNDVFTAKDRAKLRAQYVKAESIFTRIAEKYAGIPAKDGHEQVPGDPAMASRYLKDFLGDDRQAWSMDFLSDYVFQSNIGDGLTAQLTRWMHDLTLAIKQYSLGAIVTYDVDLNSRYLSPSAFNRSMALKIINKLWLSINAIGDGAIQKQNMIKVFYSVLVSVEGAGLVKQLLGGGKILPENLAAIFDSILSEGIYGVMGKENFPEDIDAYEIKMERCLSLVRMLLLQLIEAGKFDLIPLVLGKYNDAVGGVIERFPNDRNRKLLHAEFLFKRETEPSRWLQTHLSTKRSLPTAQANKIVEICISKSDLGNDTAAPASVSGMAPAAPASGSGSAAESESKTSDDSEHDSVTYAPVPVAAAAAVPISVAVAEDSSNVLVDFSKVEEIYAESVRRMGRETVRDVQNARKYFRFQLMTMMGKVIIDNPIGSEFRGIKIVMAQKLQPLVSSWLRELFENIKQIDLVNEEEYSLKRDKYNLICQDILVVYLQSIMSCESNFDFSSEITKEVISYIEKEFSLINLEGHIEISEALFGIKETFEQIKDKTVIRYLDFVYTMQLFFNSTQVLDDRKKLLVKLITGLMKGSTEGAINITKMVHKILCAYIRSTYCSRIYNDSDADILKFEDFDAGKIGNAGTELPLQKLKNVYALQDVFTEVLELFDGDAKEKVSSIFNGFCECVAKPTVVRDYESYSSYSSSLSPPLPPTPAHSPPRLGIASQVFFAVEPSAPELTQQRPSLPLRQDDSAAPSSADGLTLPAPDEGLDTEIKELHDYSGDDEADGERRASRGSVSQQLDNPPVQDASSGLTSQRLSSSPNFFTAPPGSADDSSAKELDLKLGDRPVCRLSDADSSEVSWPDTSDSENKKGIL